MKFSTDRWNNVRPYVLAGVSYDHNFSSNQENSDDNFSGEFRMKTRNFMYELGVGVDRSLWWIRSPPSTPPHVNLASMDLTSVGEVHVH